MYSGKYCVSGDLFSENTFFIYVVGHLSTDIYYSNTSREDGK